MERIFALTERRNDRTGFDNLMTQKEYLQNMELKMQDNEFLDDTNLLLRPDDKYNPFEAWELVKSQLIEKL